MDGRSPAIRTEGLTKRFGRRTVVDRIDLDVPAGAVYGFLGPNGSGKTTTIRMLLGLVRPTAGRHELLGTPLPDALPRTGALVEGPAFHPYLSGRSNLRRLDSADRAADPRTAADRIADALERVGLGAAADRHYRRYSLGMRQRLALAATLLRPHDLLLLDEPTNGLDPQGTREVRALITRLAAAGSTVFLSTHLLSEVEQVCTHVGVLHRGRLVAQASLPELRATLASDGAVPRVRLATRDPAGAVTALAELGMAGAHAAGDEVTAELGARSPERVLAELVRAGVPVREYRVLAPDLEDLFVTLTGEGFDVGG